MERKKKIYPDKGRVFVAMSGGVDSSVAAALLKDQGYDVHGVFMQGWQNPHFECTWKEDRQDAARVAGILGIPFRVLDFSREYYEKVVAYLIAEYKEGRTPNPDVMCNKEIKFGLFYDWARAQGGDFIATGHYIRRDGEKLMTAKDTNKDQTYFLWTLTREIVSHSLFPVGEYAKPEVRRIAEKYNLPIASKKDSQGICFVGKGSIADFLREYIEATRGEIRTADGQKIGEHDGLELFTIGQRHGIGTPGGSGEPYYVAAKDAVTGTLTVAQSDQDPLLYKKEIIYQGANWLKNPAAFPFACEARIRYRAPLAKCTVDLVVGLPSNSGKVVFDKPQRAVASGQSVVFYRDDELLGGGIIS